MKVNSYTVLHYGKDYLSYALQSIHNQVENINVFYTSHPSHGHTTNLTLPETKEQNYNAAFAYDPQNKVSFFEEDRFYYEGQQRDYALDFTSQNADLVLVVDSDEVWHDNVLAAALKHVWKENSARNWLINFDHLWRSFNWVCRDQNWPVRIIDIRHKEGVGYVPKELGPIYHFGYCVTDEIMRYKISCHGHFGEFRKNWYQEKWSDWKPGVEDCHPTNTSNWWMPEVFDKNQLPELMKKHPFFNLEIIR